MIIFWLVLGVLQGVCHASLDLHSMEDILLQERGYHHIGSLVDDVNEDEELKLQKMTRLDDIEKRSKSLYKDLVSIPGVEHTIPVSRPETSSEELMARIDNSLKTKPDYETYKISEPPKLDFLIPKPDTLKTRAVLDSLKTNVNTLPSKATEAPKITPKQSSADSDKPDSKLIEGLKTVSKQSSTEPDHFETKYIGGLKSVPKQSSTDSDHVEPKLITGLKILPRPIPTDYDDFNTRLIEGLINLPKPAIDIDARSADGMKGRPLLRFPNMDRLDSRAVEAAAAAAAGDLEGPFPKIEDCEKRYAHLYRMYKELGFKYLGLSDRVMKKSEQVKGFSPLVADGDDGQIVGEGYIIVPDQKLLLFGPPSDVFRQPTAQELAVYRDVKDANHIYANINGRLMPIASRMSPIERGLPMIRNGYLPRGLDTYYPRKATILDW